MVTGRSEPCTHKPRKPKAVGMTRSQVGGTEGFSPEFLKEHGPAQTLISGVFPPGLKDNKLLALSPPVCGVPLQQPRGWVQFLLVNHFPC